MRPATSDQFLQVIASFAKLPYAVNGTSKLIRYSGFSEEDHLGALKMIAGDDSKVLFSYILQVLAESDYKFIIGFDAEAADGFVALPENVSVVWPALSNQIAWNNNDGSMFSQYFVSSLERKRAWRHQELTKSLREESTKFDPKRASTPWVQAGSTSDLVSLPTSKGRIFEILSPHQIDFDFKPTLK